MHKDDEQVFGEQEIETVVEKLYEQLSRCKVMTFTGPLGAGKTTIVKRLLKRCGIEEIVTSPTFTYVNVYENDRNQRFYHFDLYRLGSLEEFLDAGFDEFLFGDGWAFIEWPEIIAPLLKKDVCRVELDYAQDGKRRLKV